MECLFYFPGHSETRTTNQLIVKSITYNLKLTENQLINKLKSWYTFDSTAASLDSSARASSEDNSTTFASKSTSCTIKSEYLDHKLNWFSINKTRKCWIISQWNEGN